jgi:hypothetical protein
MPSNVMQFAAQNNSAEFYKKWEDYVSHYKAEVMGKKVSYDSTKSLAEKNEIMHNAVKEEIAKVAGINGTQFSDAVWNTNPTYVWATFAVIGSMVDMILPDTIINDFQAFADVRSGGFGDSFSFDIKPSDLFIVSRAGNAKRKAFAQRQANGQATLVPENRMVTVEEDLYRILSGKRNLAEYAVKVAQSFETEISLDIYNAINDTYAALPAQFKEASYTQTSFVQLCQRVTAFNGGNKAIVFGTQLALSNVVPSDSQFKFQLGAEYVKTGYLGTFMGTSLFEIPQKADWKSATYGMKLDDTRLYVISTSADKLVKVALEGDTITYTDSMTANANLTQSQTVHKRWAVGLISNAHYGIIDTGA